MLSQQIIAELVVIGDDQNSIDPVAQQRDLIDQLRVCEHSVAPFAEDSDLPSHLPLDQLMQNCLCTLANRLLLAGVIDDLFQLLDSADTHIGRSALLLQDGQQMLHCRKKLWMYCSAGIEEDHLRLLCDELHLFLRLPRSGLRTPVQAGLALWGKELHNILIIP